MWIAHVLHANEDEQKNKQGRGEGYLEWGSVVAVSDGLWLRQLGTPVIFLPNAVAVQWGVVAPVAGSSPPESVLLFFPALFLLFFLLSFSSIFSILLSISLLNPPLFQFLYFFVLPSTPPVLLVSPLFVSISVSIVFSSPLLCFVRFFPLCLTFVLFFSPLPSAFSSVSRFLFFISVPLCFLSHNITVFPFFLSVSLLFVFFLILHLFVPLYFFLFPSYLLEARG